ncbi:MAG TPA: GGDEF domain-containing protein [Vicinamibacterales bacterium]|nr:GGDEF domain-containing protein [Vicinamibacterales bacterium]
MTDHLDNHIIALGLGRPGSDHWTVMTAFEVFVDDLLMLVDEIAPRLPDGEDARFRGRLNAYRTRLAQESDAPAIEQLSTECLAECRHFFERAEALRMEQHREIGAVVQLLRDTLASLAGGESGFDQELQLSADRFVDLAEIDELRTLKARLLEETESLKRAVAERQASREQTFDALAARVEMLEAQLVRTRQAAAIDGLTRLANRETFDRTLEGWTQTPDRQFVLALVDIDNFKSVNDCYGHLAGDQVLISVARALARSVRSTDLVARLGGDEFALLAPEATIRQLEARMCRAVAKIAEARFDAGEGDQPRPFGVTISCGLAELSPGDTAASMLQRADEALYGAKHRGKNRVVVKAKPFVRDLLMR